MGSAPTRWSNLDDWNSTRGCSRTGRSTSTCCSYAALDATPPDFPSFKSVPVDLAAATASTCSAQHASGACSGKEEETHVHSPPAPSTPNLAHAQAPAALAGSAAQPKHEAVGGSANNSCSPNIDPAAVQSFLESLEAPTTVTPSHAAPQLSAEQKHIIKLLAQGGADASRLVQLLLCPLDGLANIAADSGTDMLFKRLAAAGALGGAVPDINGNGDRLGTGHDQCSSTVSEQHNHVHYNHTHARIVSVLLSVLMSRAGASTGLFDLVPGVPQLLAHRNEISLNLASDVNGSTEARAMRSAGAMVSAPSLKVSDADDTFAGGTVAASAAIRAALRTGSKVVAAVPDLGNLVDGVLGSVKDSLDELDHQPASPQQPQQQTRRSRKSQ